MKTSTMLAVLALALLAFSSEGVARAGQSGSSRYDEASRLYNLGRYDDAIREYEAVYREKGDPRCLYNIAQALRLSGRLQRSIELYRKYLGEVPRSPLRGAIEDVIARMKATLEEQRQQSEQPPIGPIPVNGGTENQADDAPPLAPAPHQGVDANDASDDDDDMDRHDRVDPRKQKAPRPEPPRASGTSRLRGAGIALTIVGAAVALNGGIGFGVAAAGEGAAIDRQAMTGDRFDPSLESAGRTLRALSIGSWVVGGAVAATGVVLLAIGGRGESKPERTSWRLTPVITGDGVHLVLGGGF